MLKHAPAKHHKKKHHRKKSGQVIPVERSEGPVTSFVLFGLSAFGLFLIVVPVLFGLGVLVAFEMKYSDRFFPGVLVGGEPVGGQNYAQALHHFTEKAQELEKNGVSINLETSKGVRKINIPASAAGLTADNAIEYFTLTKGDRSDWEKDLDRAYRWGHGANILRSLTEQLTLIFIKKDFNFSAVTQREALSSLLDNEFRIFLKETVPARFSALNNKISISREEAGESVDKGEVINIIEKKISQFDTTPAVVKTKAEIPTITQADLEPFLDFAQNFARETNLVLEYEGRSWQIKGPKLVTWLTIKRDGRDKETITIDRVKLGEYLTSTVAKFIDNPPVNSRFAVRSGKLVEITPGKAGNVVDIDKVVQKIEKIIPEVESSFTSRGDFLPAAVLYAANPEVKFDAKNGTIHLPIETVVVEPKVTANTVEKYSIKNLVGEISTSFAGSSADREHNIKIGADAINGMLIAPGAEFSTISSIGPVTEKEGYVKELVIKADRTIKEFGGGLCQIATTLFRLALNAGLPVTERVNHRFVVPYYDPPGLDATIYGPHPDLRFVNDTGNYLLLQARVENKKVIMEIYGQKDGRTATVSKPYLYNHIPAPETKYVETSELAVGETKCSETPHAGVTTHVLYTVNYPDGTKKEKNFKSIYQPWQKVCLVGI